MPPTTLASPLWQSGTDTTGGAILRRDGDLTAARVVDCSRTAAGILQTTLPGDGSIASCSAQWDGFRMCTSQVDATLIE
jgi:hypothetical protein